MNTEKKLYIITILALVLSIVLAVVCAIVCNHWADIYALREAAEPVEALIAMAGIL